MNGAKFKLRYGDLTSDSDNAHKLEANNIAGDSSYINHLLQYPDRQNDTRYLNSG